MDGDCSELRARITPDGGNKVVTRCQATIYSACTALLYCARWSKFSVSFDTNRLTQASLVLKFSLFFPFLIARPGSTMISLSLVAVALIPFALAAPQPDAGVIHVPIVRRSQTDRVANLPKAMEALRAKYGYQPTNATYSKRANTAAVPITDEVRLSDFLFISPWNNHFASKMIPVTPVLSALGLRKLRCWSNIHKYSSSLRAQNFDLILDTGSSDLWVATSSCTSCDAINSCTSCASTEFTTSKSSSFQSSGTPLQINYGSGSVQGAISQDTVSFGGFTITQQELCTSISSRVRPTLIFGRSGCFCDYIWLARRRTLRYHGPWVQHNLCPQYHPILASPL